MVAAAAKLRQAGIEQPWFEAQLLLASVMELDPVTIIAHEAEVISPGLQEKYTEAVNQRLKFKPLAYITGKKAFMKWDFYVNEDVLIPRPETETLTQLAVDELESRFSGNPIMIADIGTGSGVIGLSMLALLPSARLVAVDLSEPALMVARENAQRLGVQDRVSLYSGDLLQPLVGWQGSLHCITANLPYVARADYETLQPEIALFEPKDALISGTDGLRHYRGLLRQAWDYLLPGGLVFVEIGSTQAEQVTKLFISGGFNEPRVVVDLAGKPRVVWAERNIC